jgi:hypothetical protein
MKLDALDLIAYGPFTGARLDFVHPFTIAYGPNEAGKSSTLRALLDGLFGIHVQTPDSFLHAQTREGGDRRKATNAGRRGPSHEGRRPGCIRRTACQRYRGTAGR